MRDPGLAASSSILIVDDDDNIRHALRRGLRREGYELLFAPGPLEALLILEARAVDMVISDHLMPNMTGLEFLAIVRERHPAAIRIMMTGLVDTGSELEATAKDDGLTVIVKPWDDGELRSMLRLALQPLEPSERGIGLRGADCAQSRSLSMPRSPT